MDIESRRQRLQEALSSNLDFHEQSSTYSTHALHAFAAKFPPQLPRTFIESLTSPGETVLDPMMGSGTTVLEAMLLGRRAVGVDIDPLAVRLCRVKTGIVDLDYATQAGQHCIARALGLMEKDQSMLNQELDRRFDSATRDFLDYWFAHDTQQELLALLLNIEREADKAVRELLEVVLSSTIITKSGGVSLARDLAHTRPHRVLSKQRRSAVTQFKLRMGRAVEALSALPTGRTSAELHEADARDLPLADESADLVVTSPPYANALDYMRAHKFSLAWLGQPIGKLSELRSVYIGAERLRDVRVSDLPADAVRRVADVSRADQRKGRIFAQYLLAMQGALGEVLRVLRRGAPAVVVVGPSSIRGRSVPTHELLASVAEQVGFALVGLVRRELDRNRRMMPFRRGEPVSEGIEHRLHEEFVLGMVKP
ncbi:MAG: hypothetical protein CL878_00600 [Dehalococcoidia bacterium]|nr:hypothetical protein [Dehalococcoidia bacterium]